MQIVRAAALQGFFEVAEECGANPLSLLRQVGLDRSMLLDREAPLPAVAVADLLELSAQVTGCQTFGLRMSETRNLADLGRVSVLIAHQGTLREAFGVLSTYRNRINSTLILAVEDHGAIVILREEFGLVHPRPVRQAECLALGVLMGMCRQLAGDGWRPDEVCFGYERPAMADVAVYRRVFDCPVVFDSHLNGIVVSGNALDRPLPGRDPALARHARSLIDAVMDQHERSCAEEVEQMVHTLLPTGRASLSACAEALGYNPRTLQRHLDEENASFTEIIDRVRRNQLPRHLANRKLRLTDLAGLLGYSSQGSFTRWHRATYGTTPMAARRSLRLGQAGSN